MEQNQTKTKPTKPPQIQTILPAKKNKKTPEISASQKPTRTSLTKEEYLRNKRQTEKDKRSFKSN